MTAVAALRYTHIIMSAIECPDVRPVSRLFKALGDKTRLRIVALLCHGELCVCHVVSALDISQPLASRHLAILRSAAIVTGERRGSWVYYKLDEQTDARCQDLLRTLVNGFARQSTLKADVKRLLRSCGPGACP